MVLTGNALAEFASWSHDKCSALTPLPKDLFDTLQQGLIIQWFDSVGINICVDRWSLKFWSANLYTPYRNSLGIEFTNREERP